MLIHEKTIKWEDKPKTGRVYFKHMKLTKYSYLEYIKNSHKSIRKGRQLNRKLGKSTNNNFTE